MRTKTAVQRVEPTLSSNTKKANSATPLSPKKHKQTETTTTKIFNLHSNNTQEAEDFKVISNEEYDKYGKKVVNKYVQYTIVGQNRTWPDFMPTKDFKKLNPKIKVQGLN